MMRIEVRIMTSEELKVSISEEFNWQILLIKPSRYIL